MIPIKEQLMNFEMRSALNIDGDFPIKVTVIKLFDHFMYFDGRWEVEGALILRIMKNLDFALLNKVFQKFFLIGSQLFKHFCLYFG